MKARFEIPEERLAEIRAGVEAQGRVEPVFVARIVDAGGDLVAEVEKQISIRRRRPESAAPER